jgi:prepilin-type N-terminal cleavage/methylation domain-containing protein
MRAQLIRQTQRGFTAIEIAVAVALGGLVLGNVLVVLSDTRERLAIQDVAKDVDAEARRALDRIAVQLMGAVRQQLYTQVSAPLSADSINYTSVIGVQDGEPVVSPLQRIAMTTEPTAAVSWYQNPGGEQQKHIVWTRDLRSFCEGELPNGTDDNGNGLVDEKGLSFEVDGPMVRIALTIERPGPDGKPVVKALETRITCRN